MKKYCKSSPTNPPPHCCCASVLAPHVRSSLGFSPNGRDDELRGLRLSVLESSAQFKQPQPMRLYSSSIIIKTRATVLRKNSTLPEKIVWSWIKNRQMNNLKFRRQFPIDEYILDFYCTEKKLCVEIDGDSHDFSKQAEYDEYRTLFLQAQGITVIRLSNKEVLKNGELTLEYLKSVLTKC